MPSPQFNHQSIKSVLFLFIFFFGILLSSAHASLLFFRPAGLQEDGDAIKDIVTSPNQQIEFRIFLDLSAGDPLRVLRDLTYDVSYDFNELELVGHQTDIDGRFNTDKGEKVVSNKTGFDRFRFEHKTGGITEGEGVFLDTIKFKVLPGLDNSGVEDFEFSSVLASGEHLDNLLIEQQGLKAVEVQPVVPEPGTLALFALGMIGLKGSTFLKRKNS